MIRRWFALTYYLYALRFAALSHFYFNSLYFAGYAKRCVAMEKAACMAFFNVQAAFFGR